MKQVKSSRNALKIIFLILILFCITSKGQNWCPVGATWYTNHAICSAQPGPCFSSTLKQVYTGTVLVDGYACQEIACQLSQSNIVNSYTSFFYTRVVNNVVYKKINTNTFDTIFNFNAKPGDKWSLTPSDILTCSKSRVTVLDTGHKIIEGINLKWLRVNVTGIALYTFTTTVTDTIYERIGSLGTFLLNPYMVCPWYTDGTGPTSLRCYSDNQIAEFKRTNGDCNFYNGPTSIKAQEKDIVNVKIYPNPTNNNIFLELSDDEQITANQILKLELINSVGLSNSLNFDFISNGKYRLNANKIGSGVYTLLIYLDNQVILRRIIKE